jgi:hypothetical protein
MTSVTHYDNTSVEHTNGALKGYQPMSNKSVIWVKIWTQNLNNTTAHSVLKLRSNNWCTSTWQTVPERQYLTDSTWQTLVTCSWNIVGTMNLHNPWPLARFPPTVGRLAQVKGISRVCSVCSMRHPTVPLSACSTGRLCTQKQLFADLSGRDLLRSMSRYTGHAGVKRVFTCACVLACVYNQYNSDTPHTPWQSIRVVVT